ncbi:MAG: hypothetical protein ACLTGI_05365 [Hoylesella buccalis]
MENQFTRTEMLFGTAALEKLSRSHVMIFGVGGVEKLCGGSAGTQRSWRNQFGR